MLYRENTERPVTIGAIRTLGIPIANRVVERYAMIEPIENFLNLDFVREVFEVAYAKPLGFSPLSQRFLVLREE